ncbi:MAG: hypothetical protein CVT92_01470 [Bacteroidetes bacterium HGW-Bacteroidetes-1]|jgi:predicted component of type VI protein secretion system|nr:MAG: hypothetical protein CVT92_01470 [Bacteroidetes bacterium HGW-Bacteroidetes-1]
MTKETENISKIREILFGNNLTELEKRFVRTESFLRDEISMLQAKVDKGFEEISASSKLASNEIDHQLHEETESRIAEMAQLREDVSRTEKMFQQLSEKLSAELEGIKQLLTEHLESNSKQQQKNLNDLKLQLFGQVEDVRNTKVDRSALAVLLSEIALQLVDKEDDLKKKTLD